MSEDLLSLSHTRRQVLAQCPSRWHLEYLWGGTGLETVKGPGLRMGGAFSDALEQWDTKAAHAYYVQLFGEEFTEEQLIELAVIQALAEGYFERYARPNMREVQFSFPIPGTGYHDNGRIDGLELKPCVVIEDKLLASVYLVDGTLGTNQQITAMLNAASRMGYDPTGCKFRVTQKPRKRRMKRDPETAVQYVEWLRNDISRNPDKYYFEFWQERTTEQFAHFEATLVQTARILDTYKVNDLWPLHGDRCKDFGGCPFQGVCSGQISQEHILDHFSQKEAA